MNQAHPGAQRALLHARRRGLQMVLRLLAANAELWLAGRLNAYLRDLDEYRAITRHLLHQPGHIAYHHARSPSPSTRPAAPAPPGHWPA